MQILRYLFWPNPGFADYRDPDIIVLLLVCAAMVLGSFALSYWRRKKANPIARKLSASWSSAAFWFGLVGAILVVSRVEDIQFIAMRFLLLLWGVLFLLYVFFQIKKWRRGHYEVLPTQAVRDPRDPYLPKRKKRK